MSCPRALLTLLSALALPACGARTGLDLDASRASPGGAGAGGTTFRFLLAYLALRTTQPVVLTGSARLQKRPIAGLVEALRTLGADITYTEQEGFAPVCITPVKKLGGAGEVRIDSSISSQFISALMMIAPYLHTRNGLTIHLEGNTVSSSYITLTIAMMQRLGVNVRLNGSDLHIPRGSYHTTETHIEVESDWSGASYWFAMAAVAAISMANPAVAARYMRLLGSGAYSSIAGSRSVLPTRSSLAFPRVANVSPHEACPSTRIRGSGQFDASAIVPPLAGEEACRSRRQPLLNLANGPFWPLLIDMVRPPSGLDGHYS